MNDAPTVSGPSDALVWAEVGSFEPDPGERLEALATTGRGPLRVAARLAVAVEARLGGWHRRRGPGSDVPSGDAVVPDAVSDRRPAPVAAVHSLPGAPRSRSAAVLAETRARAAGGPHLAVTAPAAAARPPERPAGRSGPHRRPRPLQAERGRTTAALIDEVTLGSCTPFPAALEALADRRGPGVGDDDAWDRWVSSGEPELARADTALDRAPNRAERAEANLQRAASRLRTGRRRMAAALHPAAPGPAGTGR